MRSAQGDLEALANERPTQIADMVRRKYLVHRRPILDVVA